MQEALPAPPPRARGRRADRVAARLPVDGGHAARDRPAALGAGPARDATSASGCPSRSSPTPRTTRPRRPRWPTRCRSPSSSCSRACRPSSAPRSCCARCSTTPTTGSPRSSARARPNARQLAARARRHVEERRPRFEASREQRERARRPLLRGRRGGRPRRRSRRCSPQDVVLHGDGGGKAPGARARAVTAARGWRARCAPGLRAARARRRRHARAAWRSTASRARCSLDRDGRRDQRDGARHRRRPDPGRQLDRQPRQAAATSAPVADLRALLQRG